MSLKSFHIVLMSSAALLAAGLIVWAVDRRDLGLGFGAFAAVLALLYYLRWFLAKARSKGW